MKQKTLGKICKIWRRKQGKSQTAVAMDTGYSTENVSAFERGINDNGMILLWYLTHGLTIEEIVKGGEEIEKRIQE